MTKTMMMPTTTMLRNMRSRIRSKDCINNHFANKGLFEYFNSLRENHLPRAACLPLFQYHSVYACTVCGHCATECVKLNVGSKFFSYFICVFQLNYFRSILTTDFFFIVAALASTDALFFTSQLYVNAFLFVFVVDLLTFFMYQMKKNECMQEMTRDGYYTLTPENSTSILSLFKYVIANAHE